MIIYHIRGDILMKCEFDYCIYNKSFSCIVEEIKINSLGLCDECEIVAIPKEILIIL